MSAPKCSRCNGRFQLYAPADPGSRYDPRSNWIHWCPCTGREEFHRGDESMTADAAYAAAGVTRPTQRDERDACVARIATLLGTDAATCQAALDGAVRAALAPKEPGT